MKKMLMLLPLLFVAVGAQAGPAAVKMTSIKSTGVAVTVSVSTMAWTVANSTTSLVAGRSGYFVTSPAANTGAMYALCKAAAPTEAITVRSFQILDETKQIECGPNLNLYLISIHSAAENAHIQEYAR